MDLIDDYIDTEEDEDILEDDDLKRINESAGEIEQSYTDAAEKLLIPDKEKKEAEVNEESPRESARNSLYFNIKKQEELARKRLRGAKLQNEIEEIGIRDLFIKDAVKLTKE